ncbi:MAG: tetratricopeptide repeat protein [Bacteroidales bacterium]|nr:tetratricopeptide repeat protein [Bacteroidales bacterium]
MKTLRKLTFIFGLITILSSCSSTNLLTMSVTEPAIVYLPKSIEKIGVINRSLPNENKKLVENLDKILTIEGKNLDKDAANEAVKGAFESLIKTNRFSSVKNLDTINLKSVYPGVFPPAIDWASVNRICEQNEVQALFVLSFFDTDSKIHYKTQNVEVTGPLGVKIPAIEHHATLATLVKTGWRIYLPSEREIIDELVMSDEIFVTGKGINPAKAIATIAGRKDAVNRLSYNFGYSYPPRIMPNRIRVSREYFVRGTDNFKIAKRRAQTGDWDGAAKLWAQETNHPKSKVAGRAYYNMAIINEINGNLDEAIVNASKSYTDYKNKRALNYLNILRYRINQQNELKRQEE